MARGGRPRSHPIRQRTCLGCRAVHGQAELVRLVVDERGLVTDEQGGAHGRGAWVCRTEACTRRAVRQLGRALRVPGLSVAPEELWALVSGRHVAVGVPRVAPGADE